MEQKVRRLFQPSRLDMTTFIEAVQKRERSRVIALLSGEDVVIDWPKYFDGATPEDKQFIDECRAEWEEQIDQEEEQAR